MEFELGMMSASDTADAVRTGDLSATMVVEHALSRIRACNENINSFAHVAYESALIEAASIDARVASGDDPGPLAGVPIGAKDVSPVAGMPLTHGSELFAGASPSLHDAVQIGRLRAAGAIVVGVTTEPEFGTASYTRSKLYGVTRNPWDLTRTPGGSSGGSAASVSSGMALLATGSDGGGSLREPAAFCGLVGLKTSHGRIPYESSGVRQMTVCGALTTTVRDTARYLDVVSGPHDLDRTSLPASGVCFEDSIERGSVEGLRAAWSPDLGFADTDPEVAAICEDAAMLLFEEARLDVSPYSGQLGDCARVWRGLGIIDIWVKMVGRDWESELPKLTPSNRRSFERTEMLSASKYAEFLAGRTQIEQSVAALFEEIDVLVTPTTTIPAFGANGKFDGMNLPVGFDHYSVIAMSPYANLAWNPAITVPAGVTSSGLPVGLQIMGRRFSEDTLLRLARILEQARPWPLRAPGY